MSWSYEVQLTLVIVFGVAFVATVATMVFVRRSVSRRGWRLLLLLALFLLSLSLAAAQGLTKFMMR